MPHDDPSAVPHRAVLTSESVLRLRDREEVTVDLAGAGRSVRDVREAPDRPGLEMVFLAGAG